MGHQLQHLLYNRQPLDSNYKCFLRHQPADLPHEILDLPSLHNYVSQFFKIDRYGSGYGYTLRHMYTDRDIPESVWISVL